MTNDKSCIGCKFLYSIYGTDWDGDDIIEETYFCAKGMNPNLAGGFTDTESLSLEDISEIQDTRCELYSKGELVRIDDDYFEYPKTKDTEQKEAIILHVGSELS